jgi:hypothetical protein
MTHEDHGSQSTRLIWHYTTQLHFPSILKEQKIRTEDPVFVLSQQLPVTWFSLNRIWEPTACKVNLPEEVGATILRDATAAACGGLVRIGVDQSDAPFRTHQLIKIARADRWTVKALIRCGLRCGANPEDWRFTPNEMPEDRWRAIQVWDDESGTWVPYEHERRIPIRRDELVGAID